MKGLGLETCVTLGMLGPRQAEALKQAGLDYYNHNLDTGPDYYETVVSTRTYQDRLDTLSAVREAGISVCCGGIVGMGETRRDRAGLLHSLAVLPEHPDSLPINDLMPTDGTPLGHSAPLDGLEFIRTIAVARLVCPKAVVRLSAGREHMSREQQALCFLAGANSIFVGDKLLTTPNPDQASDARLFADLGLRPMGYSLSVAAAGRASSLSHLSARRCWRTSRRPEPYRSSSKRPSTRSARASTAARASGPSALISIEQPRPAASIIRPMIERASTVWPSRVTVTSASKPPASFTNLADARACRPRSLVISTVRATFNAGVLLVAGEDIGGDRDIFAARLLGVGDAVVQAFAPAHAGQLDQHRQVQPGNDLGVGLLHH